MQRISFFFVLTFFIQLSVNYAQHSDAQLQQINWKEYAPGIWVSQLGEEQPVSLLDAAGAEPDFSALRKLPSVDFPLPGEKTQVAYINDETYLRMPLESSEEIYGFGLQFKSTVHNGNIYNLHVDHYGGEDNGRTHAPLPFYISNRRYGVLINSAQYLKVYVGTTVRTDSPDQPPVLDRNTNENWNPSPESNAIEILIPADGAEIYVFAGTHLMDVVKRYNLFNGGGVLPPKCGLGFTYRTHRLYSAKDVIKEVRSFRQHDFPLDFIGLEPGWMSASYPCTYEWSPVRFPNPERFVRTLLDQGVRTNLWMNPYVAPGSTLHDDLKPFAGTHSVWMGIVPDYMLQEPREIFLDFYQSRHLDIGVSGLKIDEVDGYDEWLWPDMATFPSALTGEQMRQVYGLRLQKMIAELYRENNIRTYGLVRASNTGASSLPFVLYNDYYSHRDFITALVNSGFSGLLWTPEARSSDTGEEWLRRMQSVCFSPMAMINAWASGTKPWSFPDVYDAVQQVASLRMQLLPYVYTTFAQYHFQGIPPVRPMVLLEEFDPDAIKTSSPGDQELLRDIRDQYLFGDNLLVAPMFAGETTRTVILPGGKWYDFYTGEYAGSNEIILVKPGLDKIPLFVRNGGIIPMIEHRLHAPEPGTIQSLTVRHYGDAESDYLMYDDDGVTFNYENGDYSWTKLMARTNASGDLYGNLDRLKGNIFQYLPPEWVFMSQKSDDI